ncbi:MAG: site-2 protease family protein [Chloroflexi bacterium]|nr:site-2 protease family protein [Chloroflexota bacterium]
MTTTRMNYRPPMNHNPYTPDKPTVSLDAVQAMRTGMAPCFAVNHTGLDEPFRGAVQFHGRFLQDSAVCFDTIHAVCEEQDFTPTVNRESDQRVVITAEPGVIHPQKSKWQINALLFILTIFSTLITGAISEAQTPEQIAEYATQLWRGIPFSASILLILGAHEMGHYLAARYHKVEVTLPYFIPLPVISPIGTLGAFIQLKERVKNKRALLDIGVAGPLAGFVFAVPILFIGLSTSEVGPIVEGGLLEGNSILYAAMKILIFGEFLPNGSQDVYLNQLAWAGWVGLLVTGLNLMPVGQLDGGHITYALWGKKTEQFFMPVLILLGGLAVLSLLIGGALTWLVWWLLIFVFGRVHAEPLDDVTELDGRRRWIGLITMIIFVLVFVPVPFIIL